MKKVKGSRPYQYKVVRYRPITRVWKTIAALLVASALLSLVFWFGQTRGTFEQQKLQKQIDELESQLQLALGVQADLRQSYENARVGAEIDRGALEQVRVELSRLKENIAGLEEENDFYRTLMSPSDTQRGLTIGPVDLVGLDKPGAYRFKIVMQQLATQHDLLSGKLTVNIVGQNAGESTTLALHSVSDDVDGPEISLKFKYFQNVEGEINLPEGFEPERVELQARATKPRAVTVEKKIAWPSGKQG